MKAIQRELAKTNRPTNQYRYVGESWNSMVGAVNPKPMNARYSFCR